MRSVLKDMITSVILGMVLPGILLNGAVMVLGGAEPSEVSAATSPDQETQLPEDGLEAYLVGVVLAEMPASFELEALKAQAVAARTYAWKARATGGKHGDGTVCQDPNCCQGHLSQEDYIEKGGTWENLEKVRSAVQATAGQVLEYEGQLIEATYFSCSGGSTEEAAAVWGTQIPYLQAVDSPGEEAAQWFRDKVRFTPEEFQEKLGITLEGTPDTWFGETEYTGGGGVYSLEIGGQAYAGTLLRSLLGLRSTAFSISAGTDITITTRGYGHRVGMSQYGADAMAVSGSSYRQILAHYYPGTRIATRDPEDL